MLYVFPPDWNLWTSSLWNGCMRRSTSSHWLPKQIPWHPKSANSSRNRSAGCSLQLSCAKSCPFTLLIKKKARRDSRRSSLWHHVCLEHFAICQSIISAGTMSRSAALPPRQERSDEKIWAHPQINKQRMFLNPKQSLLAILWRLCAGPKEIAESLCDFYSRFYVSLDYARNPGAQDQNLRVSRDGWWGGKQDCEKNQSKSSTFV